MGTQAHFGARRPWPVLLLLAGYLTLAVAWLAANPPGAGPDEDAHYVRAAGLSQGEVLGRKVLVQRSAGQPAPGSAISEAVDRTYYLPAQLAPPDFSTCYRFLPGRSAACADLGQAGNAGRRLSYVGVYPPFAYLPAAALMALAEQPVEALYLGRLGIALLCSGLLILTALTLWRGRRSLLALAGFQLAITPMVLFLATTLAPSGVEVAASACFFAAVLRIATGRRQPLKLEWTALALGGFFLATSRALGPGWLIADIFAVLAFVPSLGFRQRLLQPDRCGRMALAAVGGGLILALAWGVWINQGAVVTLAAVANGMAQAAQQLRWLAPQQIGGFGWLDVTLPRPLTGLWLSALAGFGGLALWLGTWRQRLALIGLLVADLAAIVVTTGIFNLPFGVAGQGRYALPVGVLLPMACGEVVYANRGRLSVGLRASLPLAIAAATVVVQVGAWLVNSRRYATGTRGAWLFMLNPQWQPALTWWPWLLLALVGGSALMAAAIVQNVSPARHLRLHTASDRAA
ncbi:MAG: DUF2142 domain-containing protein [Candidatus Dormibacter sp.]|uniref:DUF2142 domain-containing protein n=1 Tax=Candidatus Dormibacter sp. TaxID=2973982 RepID=UPI003D9B1D75